MSLICQNVRENAIKVSAFKIDCLKKSTCGLRRPAPRGLEIRAYGSNFIYLIAKLFSHKTNSGKSYSKGPGLGLLKWNGQFFRH